MLWQNELQSDHTLSDQDRTRIQRVVLTSNLHELHSCTFGSIFILLYVVIFHNYQSITFIDKFRLVLKVESSFVYVEISISLAVLSVCFIIKNHESVLQ